MTTAFVALWMVALGLMAAGCWIPALIVAGVAALVGARFWFERQARAAMMLREPIRVD
jgi:hypothetical protein